MTATAVTGPVMFTIPTFSVTFKKLKFSPTGRNEVKRACGYRAGKSAVTGSRTDSLAVEGMSYDQKTWHTILNERSSVKLLPGAFLLVFHAFNHQRHIFDRSVIVCLRMFFLAYQVRDRLRLSFVIKVNYSELKKFRTLCGSMG